MVKDWCPSTVIHAKSLTRRSRQNDVLGIARWKTVTLSVEWYFFSLYIFVAEAHGGQSSSSFHPANNADNRDPTYELFSTILWSPINRVVSLHLYDDTLETWGHTGSLRKLFRRLHPHSWAPRHGLSRTKLCPCARNVFVAVNTK
jgi:hypothetical protein